MEALRQETLDRMIHKLTRKVNALTSLWHDIGVTGMALKNRLERTEDHVDRLLQEMYVGEEAMRQRMVATIKQLTAEIVELSEQLGLPATLPEPDLTVLQQENAVRTKAAELNLLKSQRKKEFRKLRAEEAELTAKLGASPCVLPPPTPVPSQDVLNQLSRHIAKLTEEKITRQGKFAVLRSQIIAMISLLDVRPESQLEQDVVVEDPSSFVLSASNIKAVEDYLQRLKDLEAQRRRERASLVERLALYWERLDIPEAEREDVQRSHSGLTDAALDALKRQIAKCEVLKQERMKEFITRVQDELLSWFRLCCVPERKALLEEEWDSEDWSEERLEKLEKELKTLKDFHAKNEDIFRKVERREALWARFLDYEKRLADPARLNNRGGRLLSEMKERKRLETELPRLEREITSYIDNYVGEERDVFDAWSAQFLAHLEAQHTAYNDEKERERLEREQRRQKGTTPVRMAGKRPGQGTPTCSASKMSRLGMSSTGSTTARMTPSSKAGSALQRTLTPSRAGPPKPAKRRSLKKKSVAARKLGMSDSKAPGPQANGQARAVATSKAALAVPESSFCSFEGFTRGLREPVDKQLTSSVLLLPSTPYAPHAAKTAAANGTEDTLVLAANGEKEATPAGN